MAVGVELLHTASLVHDDIVDESDTRHGGATLYARVGNALAVLVGDYLFSQAAQACVATGDLRRGATVRRDARRHGAGPDRRCQSASWAGDHAWETLTRERYYRTIRGKTASLFVLACQGTGLLAGLTSAQVTALREYGESLGLAFQVVDDILDFTSTEQELGKPVGSDLRQGTITLPVILVRDERPMAACGPPSRPKTSTCRCAWCKQSGAIAAALAEAEALVATRAQPSKCCRRHRARRAGRPRGLRHPARALASSGRGTCGGVLPNQLSPYGIAVANALAAPHRRSPCSPNAPRGQ